MFSITINSKTLAATYYYCFFSLCLPSYSRAPKDLGYFLLPNFNKQPTSVSAKARRREGMEIETRWLWNLIFGIETELGDAVCVKDLIYVIEKEKRKGKLKNVLCFEFKILFSILKCNNF